MLKRVLSLIGGIFCLTMNESISNESDDFNLGQTVLTQQQAYTQGVKEESQVSLDEEQSPSYLFPEGDENHTCADGFAHCLGKMMCGCKMNKEKQHECYNPDCDCCALTTTLTGATSLIGTLVAGVLSVPFGATSGYVATGFASSLGCIALTFTPFLCLGCAQCMGKTRFVKNFEEGQRCLPTHRCSFHNLYSCCDPCCGPSD